MQGKINFGVDFIFMMIELNARAKDGLDPASMGATLLFLLEWGLTGEEVDEANRIFWERNDNDTTGTVKEVIDRLVGHVKDNQEAKQRLIRQMVAISSLDYHHSDAEVSFVRGCSELLDMRPSEFQELVERGNDLAHGLNYFGERYTLTREEE